jgi:HAD superfamily hydrolase (TIGR01509 family)
MHVLHRLVGMGGDQLVPRLRGKDSPEIRDGRAGHYQELLPDARVFPGGADLLRRVHDSGLAVVLATSSPADELDHLRELIAADDAIDAQTTADDVRSSKPAPDVFQIAMRTGCVDPERALAVGDTTWDIEAARAAGIGCVAVESGGFSHHELSEAGALHVYRDVQELREQFRTSPLAALLV